MKPVDGTSASVSMKSLPPLCYNVVGGALSHAGRCGANAKDVRVWCRYTNGSNAHLNQSAKHMRVIRNSLPLALPAAHCHLKDTSQRHGQFLSEVIDMERPRPQQSRSLNDMSPQSDKRAVKCADHEKPERHIMVKSEQPESASIPTHSLFPNADLWPSQDRRLSLITARIFPRTHRLLVFGS